MNYVVGRAVFGSRDYESASPCSCVGPQNGDKLCPCARRAQNKIDWQMLTEGIVIAGQRYKLVPDGA